ncbi:MAG: site-specific DNA-methyltransferase [Treponema sp.]|nr:site-specific DNA-methyltransferase [Treponema sp.]
MINKNILIQLKSINWNFFEKNKKLTNKLHWYPGTFPQEIPSTLIQALSNENDIIFDPFGGIGTTLAEALRLNRKCIIADINPVALLSSYVSAIFLLTNNENNLLLKEYFAYIINTISNSKEDLLNLGDITESYNFDDYYSNIIQPKPNEFFNQIIINTPKYDLLSKWIDCNTLEHVKKIYTMIEKEEQYIKKIILLEMLSNVLFSSSSQRKSWGHIADNVYPKVMEDRHNDLILSCKRWINNKAQKLLKFISNNIFQETRAIIIKQNWLDEVDSLFSTSPFDLLVTSPPYANAIDYIKSQKLSLYLFGYSDIEIVGCCENEIGARTRRRYPNSTEKWAEDLVTSIQKQILLGKENALYSFILPSEDEKRIIGNTYLSNSLLSNNKELVFEIDRSINQQRTTQSWTSIKKEKILIFKNKE